MSGVKLVQTPMMIMTLMLTLVCVQLGSAPLALANATIGTEWEDLSPRENLSVPLPGHYFHDVMLSPSPL